MKKNRKIIAALLTVCMVMSLTLSFASAADARYTYLTGSNWTDTVKNNINAMIDAKGKYSAGYDANKRPYAVFDFDNTTSIQDVEEQLIIYQLETLRFAVPSEAKMKEILLTGVPDTQLKVDGHSIEDYASDTAAAYGKLLTKGYVSADPHTIPVTMDKDADWQEFAAKARLMYDVIGDNLSTSVSYPWVTYWFTGMSSAQVRALATESHKKYMGLTDAWSLKFSKGTWTSPANYSSKTGQQSVSFNMGITISPELKELYKALDSDGIDVWVCSASFIDVIKAITDAPAVFGLEGVDGVVAMTNKMADGKWTNAYDYDLHAQTQGPGKSETIDKVIAPQYGGRGPVFVAGDSQGDFNFCTEYKDTAVCLILNRQRKDDFGILAAAAVYQQEKGIGYAAAQAAGDTLYVLQGRDENAGVYWNSNETVSIGKDASTRAALGEKAKGWLKSLESGSYASVGALIDDCVALTGKLAGSGYVGYKNRSTTGTNWYNPYTDVDFDAWYLSAVSYVNGKGIFSGVTANSFAPDAVMSRAMLATVLWRLAGSPAASAASFTDVQSGSWYAPAVRWAAANGIVTGNADGSFAPDSAVTREQLAAMLFRYAALQKKDVSACKTPVTGYSDLTSVSAYAVPAMQWAVNTGLVKGTTATTLSPQGTATRAQTAATLMRMAA